MTFDKSESYATIAVGYYDEDDTPDFLVKYQYGSGFPVYEYEQVSLIYLNILNLCLVHFIPCGPAMLSRRKSSGDPPETLRRGSPDFLG